jgi:hypothetical protein
MTLILQIAFGIVLAHYALRALKWFAAWRATPKHLRGRRVKIYSPPAIRPYVAAVPDVQYDHEGTAINSTSDTGPGALAHVWRVVRLYAIGVAAIYVVLIVYGAVRALI